MVKHLSAIRGSFDIIVVQGKQGSSKKDFGGVVGYISFGIKLILKFKYILLKRINIDYVKNKIS